MSKTLRFIMQGFSDVGNFAFAWSQLNIKDDYRTNKIVHNRHLNMYLYIYIPIVHAILGLEPIWRRFLKKYVLITIHRNNIIFYQLIS